MKKFLLSAIALIIFFNANAQSGNNCNNAIPVIPTATCTPTSYTTTDSVRWFSFVASSQYMQIRTTAPTFGINGPHLHELILYSGTCSSLQILEDEIFADVNGANEIIIDASGLIVGNTYYIKATRRTRGVCSPTPNATGTCGGVSSIIFSLCIQPLNIIIPKDFGLELPAPSHTYFTNKGQIIDANNNPRHDIKDYTTNVSPAIYHTDTSTSFVFAHVDTVASTSDTLHRVDMTLIGANTNVRTFKTEKTDGFLNYFLGHVPDGATNIRGYSRTVINDIYPNIDMQFYSNIVGTKFYFVVRPGGNADNIILNFAGASSVNVTPTKGLQITTTIGSITFEAGHAYQVNPSGNIVPMPWQAEFIQLSPTSVKLDIRSYPANMPLFIQIDRGHQSGSVQGGDWATYYGGGNNDEAEDVTTDANGNVYFAGYTLSTNFPVLSGYQSSPQGNEDGFIGKFNKNAVRKWVTYYGGSQNERVNGISYSNGNIFITGYTGSSNFPTKLANDATFSGVSDAFVAKFDTTNSTSVWSTYFGGCKSEHGVDIAADASGNSYIVGYVDAGSCSPPNNFPLINPGGGAYFQNVHGSGSYYDGFISKLNNAGTPIWSTYYGGNYNDKIQGVSMDAVTGDVCVTGEVWSNSKILSPPCLATNDDTLCLCNPGGGAWIRKVPSPGGIYALVARFSSAGNMLWSTVFSDAQRGGSGIAVNPQGDIYITGTTTNTTVGNVNCGIPTNGGFPLCNPWQSTHGGGYEDIFLARFNPSNQLVFSTYYGGNSDEEAVVGDKHPPVVATDPYGDVFVAGVSSKYVSTETFPTLAHSPLYYQQNNAKDISNSSTGSRDAFVLWFDMLNQLQWATHYGGKDIGVSNPGDEVARGIAFSNTKALYVAGGSVSLTFPTFCPTQVGSPPYCQTTNAGPLYEDAMLIRFDMSGVNLATEEHQIPFGDFLLYPNPNSGNFFCELNNNSRENIVIRVYNTVGQVIYEKEFKNTPKKTIQVNMPPLSDGIYLLSLKQGDKFITKKIIVQK